MRSFSVRQPALRHLARRLQRDRLSARSWRLLSLVPLLWREGVAQARLELRKILHEPQRQWRRSSLTRRIRLLSFCSLSEPRVSILIPVFNQWLHTYNCLRSILKSECEVSYEVVVIDNASTDRTSEILQQTENVTIERLSQNRGFLEACNIGLRAAKGREILLLNNDTTVTPGWLDALVKILDDQPECAVVGPRLLFANGLLQEAGGIVWQDASACNYGKFDDPDKPEYSFVREVDYVSGAALLVRSEVLSDGLDERYSPGFWEDVDLCFRARQLGYRVMYQPLSAVFHFEGASDWRAVSQGAHRQREANQSIFRRKWSRELLDQWPAARENLLLARDGNSSPAILVIQGQSERADPGATAVLLHGLLMAFRRQGHRVVFWPDARKLDLFDLVELQQQGVEVIQGPRDFELFVSQRRDFFALAVIHPSAKGCPYRKALRSRVRKILTYEGRAIEDRREDDGGDSEERQLWEMLGRASTKRLEEVSTLARRLVALWKDRS